MLLVVAAVLAATLPAVTPAGAIYAPRITRLSPPLGPSDGGALVNIWGTGLLGVTSVKFGDLPAAFWPLSDNTLRAVTPPGSVGVVQVRVATPFATAPDAGADDDYRYHIQPRVSSLSPKSAMDTGGGTVRISGSGFTGATSVRFGSAPASFTVVSSGTIDATLPPRASGDPGVVNVIVNNQYASSTPFFENNDDFRYWSTPRISSVTPYEGPSNGGFTIWIRGSGFADATKVYIGSVELTDMRIDTTGTEIVVDAPPHPPGRVEISIETPGGYGPTRSDSLDEVGFFDEDLLPDALMSKINNHRASKSKNRLSYSSALASSARRWSEGMPANGAGHDMSSWCPAGFRYCGELVQTRDYDGSSTAAAFVEKLFQEFKASSDHNAVMLYTFTHMGIGIYLDQGFAYVTVRFGQA